MANQAMVYFMEHAMMKQAIPRTPEEFRRLEEKAKLRVKLYEETMRMSFEGIDAAEKLLHKTKSLKASVPRTLNAHPKTMTGTPKGKEPALAHSEDKIEALLPIVNEIVDSVRKVNPNDDCQESLYCVSFNTPSRKPAKMENVGIKNIKVYGTIQNQVPSNDKKIPSPPEKPSKPILEQAAPSLGPPKPVWNEVDARVFPDFLRMGSPAVQNDVLYLFDEKFDDRLRIVSLEHGISSLIEALARDDSNQTRQKLAQACLKHVQRLRQ
jgi:hypothetical protein